MEITKLKRKFGVSHKTAILLEFSDTNRMNVGFNEQNVLYLI
jgi:hypothetical protein